MQIGGESYYSDPEVDEQEERRWRGESGERNARPAARAAKSAEAPGVELRRSHGPNQKLLAPSLIGTERGEELRSSRSL